MKPLSLVGYSAVALLVVAALLSGCGHQEVRYEKVTEYKAVTIPKNMTTVQPAPQPTPIELYMQGKNMTRAGPKEREEYLSDYIAELLKDRRGLETQFTLIEDYQKTMVKKIEEMNHATKTPKGN